MDEKIQKYFFGKMTDEEKSQLFSEMNHNKEMQEEFVRIQNSYSLAQMIDEAGDKQFAEKGLKNLKQQTNKIKVRRIIRQTTKYAAMLLLTVGLWWAFQTYLFGQDENEIQYTEYISEAGRRKEIMLPDGTKVHLGPSSRIKVPNEFAADVRQVELDGEALFDVTGNPNHPFIVKTDMYDVRVLGTVFSTIAYSQHNVFETSLLEGAVVVYNQEEEIELKPYEGVAMVDGTLMKLEADLNDIYYLQSGVYRFEEASLKKLFDKFCMWYDVEFEITNEQILKNTLTGKFRENDNIEHVLTAIQPLYPFNYKKSKDGTYIIY